VLDHSSDNFSFGGKVAIDATIKHIEEITGRNKITESYMEDISRIKSGLLRGGLIKNFNLSFYEEDIPILIISVNRTEDADVIEKIKSIFRKNETGGIFRLIVVVDHTVDVNDLFMVSWQLLGNTDPQRDHDYISPQALVIDGTIKAFRKAGFPRKWPNVVSSDSKTITIIDNKWNSLGIGKFIDSPSSRYIRLNRSGTDEILIDQPTM
jgi:4-hydroxy-3-polyprenylbenzoate decarboxylase